MSEDLLYTVDTEESEPCLSPSVPAEEDVDSPSVPEEECAGAPSEERHEPGEGEGVGETLVERLAEEYLSLVEELPDVGAFEQLPPSVLAEAANGHTLAEAYFRYAYFEKCRIEDERARQSATRAAATGSLAGEAVSAVGAAEAAMMRGIWNS